ncbi:tyrosine-type recombinase/integrase [Candidatus Uabimicrobium amorphum]|uniref:Tyrosine recombinase XerC n=1 Tax=Uabimicrobium amorphum TaxID=2596890 RepID=A0A5S9IM65_UABAM|nr:site-specific integrase [Candidatus Uabimicrobium amorphum]BBM84463.1 tyrosine recombinase XerC [Candidatus Uabimicrobium amorphum]
MVHYRKDRKCWVACWQDSKENRRKKSGFDSKKNAEIYEARQKILTENNLARGVDYDIDITVEEIVARYLEKAKYSMKTRSFEVEKQCIEKVLEYFSEESLTLCRYLKSSHLQGFIMWRKETITPRGSPPSDITINKNIASIKRVFKYGKDYNLIPNNPFKSFKAIRVDKEDAPRILTKEDVKIIEELAIDSVVKNELFFLVRTGMRASEMINLEVGDCDIEKKKIIVRSYKAKSRRTRFVPMTKSILELMKTLVVRANDEKRKLVFVNSKGRKHNLRNVLRRFQTILRKAEGKGVNIDGVSIHTLRKTYISHMIMSGEDPAKVMKIVGHESWSTMKKYLYLTENYLNDIPEIF